MSTCVGEAFTDNYIPKLIQCSSKQDAMVPDIGSMFRNSSGSFGSTQPQLSRHLSGRLTCRHVHARRASQAMLLPYSAQDALAKHIPNLIWQRRLAYRTPQHSCLHQLIKFSGLPPEICKQAPACHVKPRYQRDVCSSTQSAELSYVDRTEKPLASALLLHFGNQTFCLALDELQVLHLPRAGCSLALACTALGSKTARLNI